MVTWRQLGALYPALGSSGVSTEHCDAINSLNARTLNYAHAALQDACFK